MTDIEKHDCSCDHHEDCDCGDDCQSNIITLDTENGPQQFEIQGYLEHEGVKYLALSEVDSSEYDIFAMKEDGDMFELSDIEDDDLFNTLADLFDDLFAIEMEEMTQPE